MSKKKNLSLFDDEEEEQDAKQDLGFNKGYATRYDNWRRLEEMQKIKDRYGDLEDDGNSSSSESEPEWTDEHEEAFLKTLGALKSGDRSFFENGKSYFKEVEEATSSQKNPEKKQKKKKDEKITIKDYERKLVLEKGGQIDEDDDDEEIERKEQREGYHEEQEKLRKSLSAAINSGIKDDGDDFLVERKKTKLEQVASVTCHKRSQGLALFQRAKLAASPRQLGSQGTATCDLGCLGSATCLKHSQGVATCHSGSLGADPFQSTVLDASPRQLGSEGSAP
ncbi:unnamed protein product [Caenorhabditis angaria]|uniref:Protein KRI1 homolog n=1 Tax=Caenorhabditis angaria TaxID=860376 RepID=A0A9P1I920_9PELO|nr:unnamed protein product [Caenorhabditis angaria]